MASQATKMVREESTVIEPVIATETVKPTEEEIAAVAYQLWLDSGCPIGMDQEHWFQAEAMLTSALVAEREARVSGSANRCDIRNGADVVTEFTSERWEGHWEIWEREWGGARWVWDALNSGVRMSNRRG